MKNDKVINVYPCEEPTRVIQRAIDKASVCGGGEVVIHDGEYVIKSILLRSGVRLYLKAGVLIKGSKDLEDYDLSGVLVCPENEDYKSVENAPMKRVGRASLQPSASIDPFSRWSRALIKAYRAKDISIVGEKGATFDGQNVYDELGEEGFRGPHFLNFHECENVRLQGYTLRHSSNWGNAIFTSNRVVIESITVLGGHDGIDIMSCDDVVIRDCDLQTGDDCIAGFDCQNVLVERCKLNTACNALRIGGNNFVVRNCYIYGDGNYGHRTYMSLDERIRGEVASAENSRVNTEAVVNYYCDYRFKVRKPIVIFIENCQIENCDKLFDYGFTDEKRQWIKNKPMEFISFRGIKARNLKKASELYAPKDLPLEIVCKNCEFEIKSGEFAVFENVSFGFENVSFVGTTPRLKGLDGQIYPLEQEK